LGEENEREEREGKRRGTIYGTFHANRDYTALLRPRVGRRREYGGGSPIAN
jgi:hypothetical protein